MKPTLKHLALLLMTCFAIWACTKEVETIISIDYEINEDFESEGFVNGSLPTTVNIVPIQVLEGFDYFVKYEVVSGNGFYSSGSGIIAPNEFMPLSGLNFSGDYIPETSGEHKVKFTIRDEVGLEESTTLTYSISNLDLNWVATTNAREAGIGQEFPITLTLANNTEGSTSTFTRTIRLTSGTATVSNSNGAVALNSKAGITPGTYNFTAVASETGTLTIEFELEDNSGQTKTTRVSVDITTEPVNQAPTAVATSDITTGTAPLTVQFDGSGSTDPEESTLTYSWNLTNQSGTTVQTLTGSNPSFQFTNPGTYSATLTVTDAEDATGTDTVVITVSASDNVAPTASIDNVTPISGVAPLSVSFTGSGTDQDGTISGYSWNFGDNTNTATGTTASHNFITAGTYEVVLTVTDNDGATGTDTIRIVVSPEPENTAPVANDDSATIIEGETLTINVLANDRDADGDVLSIDMSSSSTLNGTTVDNGDNTITYTPTGGFVGNDSFTYTVTDGNGGTDTAVLRITVEKNDAPVANASAGIVLKTATFSSSGTSDDRGIDNLTYLWNFGDGNTSSYRHPTHTYTEDGTYNVRLTVTDAQGKTAVDNISVTTRFTHLNTETGDYTAPTGSSFNVSVELRGGGDWARAIVTAGIADTFIIGYNTPDTDASGSFSSGMPFDSNTTPISAIFETNTGNTSSHCRVIITHSPSGEEYVISIDGLQNFPNQ